jgi:hypothetical protein
VFGAIYFYVTLPPLNLHSGDFYVFVLLLCAVYCGCAVLTSGFQGSGAKGYFGFVKKQCTVPFVLGLVLVVTALIGAARSPPKISCVPGQSAAARSRSYLLLYHPSAA